MKYSRRIIISIAVLIVGIALFVCSYAGLIDSFWSGFGVGFVIVGALQVVRQIKYRSNEEYKEKVDVALSDERNRFIANKAWAWAGYLFVFAGAIACVVFKILGYEELMMFSSFSICFIVIVYYISYAILKRKY
ncbi:MAG: hypothetical protein IJD68_00825 [Ruminococcus sp.]|nr:hypothetical protein [Ruminococcus sp.]